MRRLGQYISTAIGLAIIAGALYAAWPAVLALAQTTGSWPVATTTTFSGATAVQIIGANPSRRALQICNVSDTPNHVWIAPINPSGVTAVSPVANGGYFLAAMGGPATSPSMSGSCYSPPPGIIGGIGAAWRGISPTSAGTVLVLEY